MKPIFITILICMLTGIIACKKENSAPAPQPQGPPYFPLVKTIVQNHCLNCHSFGGAGMPILLNTDTLIAQKAAAIKAAVADPVSPMNKRMPMDDTLSATDIDIIVNWYTAGGTLNVAGIHK